MGIALRPIHVSPQHGTIAHLHWHVTVNDEAHTFPPHADTLFTLMSLVLWHRPGIWTILGAGSGKGDGLRQTILPMRTRHIMGTTMWIARGVKTKIGIVDHID
jgi:hypothetical protein